MMYRTTRASHKRWLGVSSVLIGIFGPIALMATTERGTEPARLTLSLLSQQPQVYSSTARFLSALIAGFLLGWGVLVWCLRLWVYDIAPEQVRRCVLASVLVWFFTDSIGSVLSENYFNVAMNVDALLLIIGPLWLPAVEDTVEESTEQAISKPKIH